VGRSDGASWRRRCCVRRPALRGYLLVLQLFVIDAVCIWCLANDVFIAPALAVLTALRLRSPPTSNL
jgi:uncharacterized membrane protein